MAIFVVFDVPPEKEVGSLDELVAAGDSFDVGVGIGAVVVDRRDEDVDKEDKDEVELEVEGEGEGEGVGEYEVSSFSTDVLISTGVSLGAEYVVNSLTEGQGSVGRMCVIVGSASVVASGA